MIGLVFLSSGWQLVIYNTSFILLIIHEWAVVRMPHENFWVFNYQLGWFWLFINIWMLVDTNFQIACCFSQCIFVNKSMCLCKWHATNVCFCIKIMTTGPPCEKHFQTRWTSGLLNHLCTWKLKHFHKKKSTIHRTTVRRSHFGV